MSLVPQGNEIGLQVVGTALSYVTGVPFIGSALSAAFGNNKRPRWQEQFWSRTPAPEIHDIKEMAAANKVFRAEYAAGAVERYARLEKGQFVIRTHLRPDTRAADAAAREAKMQKRQADQAAKKAARKAKRENPRGIWAGPA